jgi:NMD protein affecting ribosome stability and mRNA decay
MIELAWYGMIPWLREEPGKRLYPVITDIPREREFTLEVRYQGHPAAMTMRVDLSTALTLMAANLAAESGVSVTIHTDAIECEHLITRTTCKTCNQEIPNPLEAL